MRDILEKIFSEDSTISLMRIMSAISFLVAIVILISDCIVDKDLANMWIGGFTYSGSTKVTQKFAEVMKKRKQVEE